MYDVKSYADVYVPHPTTANSNPVDAGGVFTHRDTLGWQPREGQMKKQGNWWLMGLVHYDHQGEVLLIHRVTGEVNVFSGHAPKVSG